VNVFEFLLITVSIVLGLSIAELLAGVGRLLRGDLQWGKLHSLWVLIIFQVQVQLAWGIWGLQGREAWRYPEFILMLLAPAILYMAAAVLFPQSGEVPADEYLIGRRRPLFLLMAAYVVQTGFMATLLMGEDPLWAPTVSRAVATTAFVVLAVTDDRRVHWALAPVILASNLWYTYVFTFLVAGTPVSP
jgi:hypothetical protein